MEYVVRNAKISDIRNVINLATNMVVSSVSPYREIPLEDVKKYRKQDLKSLYQTLKSPNIGVFIAERKSDKKFMGHVIVMNGYIESSTGESQGYIFDLSVVEDFQRMGIGNSLMNVAQDFCLQGGMRCISLNVTSVNKKAVSFYEKYGFSEERKSMIKIIKQESIENKNHKEK